jgi:hypothetical protein
VDVPDVVGWELTQAEERLRASGIVVSVVVTAAPCGHATGAYRVLAQTDKDRTTTLIVAREMTQEDARRPMGSESGRT